MLLSVYAPFTARNTVVNIGQVSPEYGSNDDYTSRPKYEIYIYFKLTQATQK